MVKSIKKRISREMVYFASVYLWLTRCKILHLLFLCCIWLRSCRILIFLHSNCMRRAPCRILSLFLNWMWLAYYEILIRYFCIAWDPHLAQFCFCHVFRGMYIACGLNLAKSCFIIFALHVIQNRVWISMVTTHHHQITVTVPWFIWGTM